MQTLTEIRGLLDRAGLAPHRRFGQNFLIDFNLLGKLLDLAAVRADSVVLEVGPGTGSLTEELLARAAKVVAVEIDRGFYALIEDRLRDRANLALLCADVLVGKHAIEPRVLEALGPAADLVSNLPYSIATPLVAQCITDTWRAAHGQGGLCRFGSLTFTVQDEVAQRLCAKPDTAAYGPVSVLVALLGRVELGPLVPAKAFWPAPQIVSRMMRIEYDDAKGRELLSAHALTSAVAMAFGQRRKQIGSVARRKNAPYEPAAFLRALEQARIAPSVRAQEVHPRQFLALANSLGEPARAPQRR